MSSSSVAVAPNSPRQSAASVNAPTVPTHIMGDSSKSPNANASLAPSPVQDNSTEQIIEKISNIQDLENQKYDELNILLASFLSAVGTRDVTLSTHLAGFTCDC